MTEAQLGQSKIDGKLNYFEILVTLPWNWNIPRETFLSRWNMNNNDARNLPLINSFELLYARGWKSSVLSLERQLRGERKKIDRTGRFSYQVRFPVGSGCITYSMLVAITMVVWREVWLSLTQNPDLENYDVTFVRRWKPISKTVIFNKTTINVRSRKRNNTHTWNDAKLQNISRKTHLQANSWARAAPWSISS